MSFFRRRNAQPTNRPLTPPPAPRRPESASVLLNVLAAGLEKALPDERQSQIWSVLENPVDASADAETRRAFVALDWLVRVWTPAWTAMVPGVGEDLAAKLQELPPITDLASAEAAGHFVGVLESTSAQAEKTIAPYKDNLYDEAAAAAARSASDRVRVESAGAAVADAAASTILEACLAARTDVALTGATAISLLVSLDGVSPYIQNWASGPGEVEAKILSIRALAPLAAWRSLEPTAEALQQSALDLHRRLAQPRQ
ncbi:hypothetical protein Acy02nite_72310 [Actinoplanes cyaneus]|uniref:Uncharacterized protein n=1 Tax=Actinoplanes cyaneus TaxID=52696 RepID=A0A919M4G1_9ACTN|nr:hypothetical protein [Actinoplanes cyaneus]MCW2142330.1 hypothetical protein [Actinoplanes cyaneus]GID69350.1 hypothetical protein Acy02nite_72310 [Actinoplanes cyaneus]